MPGANELDFLGEGLVDQGDAPALTEEEMRRWRESKQIRERKLAELATPYGTALSPTAGKYEVTTREGRKGSVVAEDSTLVSRVNADGSKTVVADYDESHPYDPLNPGVSVGRSAFPAGVGRIGQVPNPYSLDGGQAAPASQITEDAGRRSDEGAKDRRNALQSIIDRFDEAKASFDTTQQDQSRLAQQQALRQNQEIFDRASSFDRDAAAARYSEEALANSLAIARSAPGGASRASALFNALEAAPSIQAEAQRQANQEGRQQQQVALQASAQLGQVASQTRSQDEQQAEAFTGIGLDVAREIANASGRQLELDQRDREFLGEVALSVARLDLDIEKLGVDESLRLLEIELAKQGLEQEWKIFKQSQKVTGKDILGGIFSLGGAAISGGFTALAAKLKGDE